MIVKRLLNIGLIVSIAALIYGLIIGAINLRSDSAERITSCQYAADFERALKQFEKNSSADWKSSQKELREEAKRRIPILRDRCNQPLDYKLLLSGNIFILNAFVIAMLVVSMNYILFGRFILWNKESVVKLGNPS